MENKNDIRDINKLREEIYDIISDSIAWGDTECVVAIGKNDGKFEIFTDFEKNIDKDTVVEFLPVDKLIRVDEDGNEEPDSDAIDEVANKWIANFSCFSKRNFSLSENQQYYVNEAIDAISNNEGYYNYISEKVKKYVTAYDKNDMEERRKIWNSMSNFAEGFLPERYFKSRESISSARRAILFHFVNSEREYRNRNKKQFSAQTKKQKLTFWF